MLSVIVREVWSASLAMKSGITLVRRHGGTTGFIMIPGRVSLIRPTAMWEPLSILMSHAMNSDPRRTSDHDLLNKDHHVLADKAIKASGLLNSDIPRERIGVLISQNSGEAAGTLTNTIIRAYVHDILAGQQSRSPHADQKSAIEREVNPDAWPPTTLHSWADSTAQRPASSATCMGSWGRVMRSQRLRYLTGRTSQRYPDDQEWHYRCRHRGGGKIISPTCIFWNSPRLEHFTGCPDRKTRSRDLSPFDAERAGMVLGEGGGMIVIERESLARARGHLSTPL